MAPDTLLADMKDEYRKWRFSTRVYGTLYPASRTFLIVSSGLVAAKESLVESPLSGLVAWIPVLAFAVTIVTSLDTWIRPRDKWRGFMQDRDDLMTLIHQAESHSLDGQHRDVTIAGLADLRRRHHDKNVY